MPPAALAHVNHVIWPKYDSSTISLAYNYMMYVRCILELPSAVAQAALWLFHTVEPWSAALSIPSLPHQAQQSLPAHITIT